MRKFQENVFEIFSDLTNLIKLILGMVNDVKSKFSDVEYEYHDIILNQFHNLEDKLPTVGVFKKEVYEFDECLIECEVQIGDTYEEFGNQVNELIESTVKYLELLCLYKKLIKQKTLMNSTSEQEQSENSLKQPQQFDRKDGNMHYIKQIQEEQQEKQQQIQQHQQQNQLKQQEYQKQQLQQLQQQEQQLLQLQQQQQPQQQQYSINMNQNEIIILNEILYNLPYSLCEATCINYIKSSFFEKTLIKEIDSHTPILINKFHIIDEDNDNRNNSFNGTTCFDLKSGDCTLSIIYNNIMKNNKMNDFIIIKKPGSKLINNNIMTHCGGERNNKIFIMIQ